MLAHKPGLIVTVWPVSAAGIPWTSCGSAATRRLRLCYIPDHVIVRNVGHVLKGEQPADEADESLRNRLQYSVRMLLEYARALRSVRESGVVDLRSFPYGM